MYMNAYYSKNNRFCPRACHTHEYSQVGNGLTFTRDSVHARATFTHKYTLSHTHIRTRIHSLTHAHTLSATHSMQ